MKMIRKIFFILLCLSLCNCGGFSLMAGAKFKKPVDSEVILGNPSHTADTIRLSNGKYTSFKRPIGKCGAGITFFGILLPVIPVKFALNNCEKEFVINGTWQKNSNTNLKLQYNGSIYDPMLVEKKDDYTKEFKFKIKNFWKFRMANDKAIIVIIKTEDGKEFTQELPVKWGIMRYYEWTVP